MELNHPQLNHMVVEVYRFCHDLFYSRKRGRVIIIYGSNGCGKTHAAKAVMRWFNAVRLTIGPVAVIDDATDTQEARMPDCLFRNWSKVVDGFKQDQWLIADLLANEYLTILDDIGAEHDPSKLGAEKLCLILNRREFKHTIITTNFNPAEWEQKFERRIASRLFRNATHIDLSQVPDYNA